MAQQDKAAAAVYLMNISSSQYDEAKTHFGASFAGLFDGSFDQFQARRSSVLQSYLSQTSLNTSLATFSSTLPAEARAEYFDCVIKIANVPGIFLTLSEEDAAGAFLLVRYVDSPSVAKDAAVDLSFEGATNRNTTIRLRRGGSKTLTIARQNANATIKVTANTIGFGDVAISPWPPPTAPAATYVWRYIGTREEKLWFGNCGPEDAETDGVCAASTEGVEVFTANGAEYKRMDQIPPQGIYVVIPPDNPAKIMIHGQGACGNDREQIVNAKVYRCEKMKAASSPSP